MVIKKNFGIVCLTIAQLFIVFQLAACANNSYPQISQSMTDRVPHTTPTTKTTATTVSQYQNKPLQLPRTPPMQRPKTPVPPRPTPTPFPQIIPTPTHISHQAPLPTASPISNNTVQGVTPQPSTAELNLMQQLFALINQDRANAGQQPYIWDNTLVGTAYRHSIAMTQCGISHACPGEPQPCQRIQNAGLNYSSCGENVGQAAATPTYWDGIKQIEADMLGEPPTGWHRINLLSTDHHHIGVGIRIDQRGYVWMTEDFTN